MTNFDYLKKEDEFKSFIDIAIVAEKTYRIDSNTCIMNCRRAMEAAIKWMYSVDDELTLPYKDNLHTLMSCDSFRNIIDRDLYRRLEFIRTYGNDAAHNSGEKAKKIAEVCLKYLFYFTDWIAYCYGSDYEEREFDPMLLEQDDVLAVPQANPEIDLKALIEENKSLKEELSKRRAQQQETYVTKPLDLSEYSTRELFIDALLMDAGWVKDKDWLNEVRLTGMPNSSGVGYADYVLYDDMQKPLAVVEAKRTCADPSKGRQQATLYADILEKQYGRRPVIFSGGEIPELEIVAYEKEDIDKLMHFMING